MDHEILKIVENHLEIIDQDGQKIVKFKPKINPENVTTNKKRKRKSNSGNAN